MQNHIGSPRQNNLAMTNRKHSVWAWITATLIALPVLYILSFGPACWWFSADTNLPSPPKYGYVGSLMGIGYQYAPVIYWPIGYVAYQNPEGPIHRLIAWYATRRHSKMYLPTYWREGVWFGVHGEDPEILLKVVF